MKKRMLIVLLALIMVLSLAACGSSAPAPAATEVPAAADPATAAPAAAKAPVPTDVPAPEAAEATEIPEPSGDIVILYTSDVHCGIDSGFGYAGLQAIRDSLIARGDAVLLVDDGDNIQGEPVGTLSNGALPMQLMNAMGYDVAIPGNHEFDYGMEQFLALANTAAFPYISCNFNKEGELIFEPYLILEAGGRKIGFVGVCTPETLTSSTPRYFQDENGEFIYGFMQDESGARLYHAVQNAIDAARGEGAEYVIVLGHLGNYAESSPYNYADVISHITGFDIFLDGHSHDSDQVVMKDRDGREVTRSAVGTKMANIGWCRISADGKLTSGLYTWNNETSVPELLGIKNEMSAAVENALDQLSEQLRTVVASTAVELTINDPEAVDTSGNPIRMIRRAETNLGDLCADAYRTLSGADIGFIIGGGIRASIPAGDITYNDILRVHPFGNEMCVLRITGQQILDALEWGSRAVPGENGGFLQVSGLTYEIHSYIESGCTEDENRYFTGVDGARRV